MKTKFFINAIIISCILFSYAMASNVSNWKQLLPKSGQKIENPSLLFVKILLKETNQLDSNLSEKLVFVSSDNSYFIFENHHPKEKESFHSELIVGKLFQEENANFEIVNFDIFNTKENANFKLDVNKKEHFYTCIKENNKMNIYDSYFNGNNWSNPQKMSANINLKDNQTSACLSVDGKTLYFTSDRKGGYGGLDIWRSEIMANGDWGPASNLGPTVNSALDEESPYLLADNVTLYFSSKGHKSTGGFDVFYTTQTEEGAWSSATNVGRSINTKMDELHFKISTDEKNAFYSTSIESSKQNFKIIKTQFNPNSVSIQ